jgi:hypothetical protein
LVSRFEVTVQNSNARVAAPGRHFDNLAAVQIVPHTAW